VEAGSKFITVYFSPNIGGDVGSGWDTHGNNDKKMFPVLEKYHLPMTDQTLPTLLEELDQRGLLETTLVVWMGEFGRIRRLMKRPAAIIGRIGYTVLLAGGGVKRGFVHGESDRTHRIQRKTRSARRIWRRQFIICSAFDPHSEVYAPGDRPVLISEGTR